VVCTVQAYRKVEGHFGPCMFYVCEETGLFICIEPISEGGAANSGNKECQKAGQSEKGPHLGDLLEWGAAVRFPARGGVEGLCLLRVVLSGMEKQ